MTLQSLAFVLSAISGLAAQPPDEPALQKALLAALRVAPLDSLTFGACTSIEIDPKVRSLPHPNSIIRSDNPIALKLGFPPDSLRTELPVRYRAYDADEPPRKHAQVVVGLHVPKTSGVSDTLSVMIVVGGCRLAGSLVRVHVWSSGPGLVARVRAIHEG